MFSNLPSKVKWAFAVPFSIGITLGILVLGLSFMMFDQIVDPFSQVRQFVLIGFFLLYFVPASLIFLYLYRKTSKMWLALLAYLFPFLMELSVYLYFIFGFFPSSFLPNNDYRHFWGSPSYDLVKAINFDYLYTQSDNLTVNYQDTVSGMTPLLFAIRKKRYDQARLLLALGADPNKTDYHTHASPLLELCMDDDTVFSKKKEALFEALLDYKANVNYVNDNQSPLLALCSKNVRNLQVYKMLIDNNVNINTRFVQSDEYLHESYKENESALNMATYRGNYDVALFLIQNGADTTMYGEWIKDVLRIQIRSSNSKDKDKATALLKLLQKNEKN